MGTLEGVKPGEVVILEADTGSRVVKVARVLKSCVTVAFKNVVGEPYEVKYRIRDGYRQGDSTWSREYLRTGTTEELEVVRKESERRRTIKVVQENLQRISWKTATLSEVQHLAAAVSAMPKVQAP